MDVPVEFIAAVERGVDLREEDVREPGGEHGLDELVEAEEEEDFVDVVGEHGEGETVCERRDKGLEPFWRRGDRVEHGYGFEGSCLGPEI